MLQPPKSSMIRLYNLDMKLDNILVATDFSPASRAALLYAIAVARRYRSKLFAVHVSNSQSKRITMDAWRTLQAEMMDHFLADRLTGVQQELLVKSGDVRTELAHLVDANGIDLVVLGTRGRTGVWRSLLGSSVAESVRQQAPCPVLTVGPNVVGEGPDTWPQRILVPTGFAPQSLYAITYASWLAKQTCSSLALLHVVTGSTGAHNKERLRSERLERLRATVSAGQHGQLHPECLIEFGSVSEKVLETAVRWRADLVVLGVHRVEREAPDSETTMAKASEIVRGAFCPVLTTRLLHENANCAVKNDSGAASA